MTAVIAWYVRLPGWCDGIAWRMPAIVAGSGSRRMSTAERLRRAFRRLRPLGVGGHGSARMRPSSTARPTHVWATFR
jgi:hypothetical protein